ncbi:MAG: nucleotide pyrophosphohydrolase [Candidatus Aenigmarchaeota archaeon]|nr:nucleotide pyrophosphohydrolase [Candidatus Aenigmarchaeota archaeon]
MNSEKTLEGIRKMISLIEKLRGEDGCPWVREQTVKKHFEELKSEIKELENAINNKNTDNLEEELGDVLWDILTLIKISEKEYGFRIEDISEKMCQKIIRRKPYVFGDEKASTPEEACKIWKRIKQEEKKS